MRLIWPAREPRKIVELANDDLAEEASLYLYASGQLSSADKQKTVSKAKLLAAAEDAELLRVPGFNINVKQDKRGYVRMTVEPTDANGAPGEVPRNTLEAG
jgi:predicted transcriptional regulator